MGKSKIKFHLFNVIVEGFHLNKRGFVDYQQNLLFNRNFIFQRKESINHPFLFQNHRFS